MEPVPGTSREVPPQKRTAPRKPSQKITCGTCRQACQTLKQLRLHIKDVHLGEQQDEIEHTFDNESCKY